MKFQNLKADKGKSNKVYIYGKHALMEALGSVPHVVKKVFLSPDMNERSIHDLLRKHSLSASTLKEKEMRKVGEDASHQGVIAVIDPGELMVPFEDFISGLKIGKRVSLVLLDELTDPHNVGAIIRSAAAFGAAGVLLPSRNQAGVTGAVVKTSAGMAFRIPLVAIGNINYTIRALKEKGFWVYGLSAEGKNELAKEKFDAPAVFVVGNEGQGIREKTLEYCDVLLSIPIDARCESLNAAVSAAVVLYEWRKQK